MRSSTDGSGTFTYGSTGSWGRQITSLTVVRDVSGRPLARIRRWWPVVGGACVGLVGPFEGVGLVLSRARWRGCGGVRFEVGQPGEVRRDVLGRPAGGRAVEQRIAAGRPD